MSKERLQVVLQFVRFKLPCIQVGVGKGHGKRVRIERSSLLLERDDDLAL